MAHQIETFADGSAGFATARIPAWHELGVVAESTMTGKQALDAAKMSDWNVRLITVEGTETAADGTVTRVACPDKRMSVRTHPVTGDTDYLGVVGADYRVVQNEECADLLDALVDESGAHIETAGSLKGGKQTFITMKLPETMTVAGVDQMDLYLAVTTSHDGSTACRVDATPVRIVCANTQRAALRESISHYEFRHTGSASDKLSDAREAMDLTWRYMTAFQAEAERMMNEPLGLDAFDQIVSRLWPVNARAGARAQDAAKTREASLQFLFRDADTQKEVRGTRWAGYQAVVEYEDHYAPASTPEIRARRAVTGSGADRKAAAFAEFAVAA